MIDDPQLDVAFVCTGNRFRSPLAAAFLEAETGDLPVRGHSLGILDLGPVPALPEAVELGQTFGLDLSNHRARNVAAYDLEPFDLVLGFERAHVLTAIVDARALIERTFALQELVELLESLPAVLSLPEPVEQARARIRQAHEHRPPDYRTRRVPEIGDPLGRAAEAQRRIAEELRMSVIRLSRALFN